MLDSLSPVLCYGILAVPLPHLCQPLWALWGEALRASPSPPELAALCGSVCSWGFAIPWKGRPGPAATLEHLLRVSREGPSLPGVGMLSGAGGDEPHSGRTHRAVCFGVCAA